MSHDKELGIIRTAHNINTGLLRSRHNSQLRHLLDILGSHFRMTGMRRIKCIIKTSEQSGLLIQHFMGKYAGNLLVQNIFRNAVMIIKPRLGTPANMEGRMHMCLTPLHNLA